MKTAKIAVSLPAAQVARAHRAVEQGAAPSVSAYVSQALARCAREDSLATLVAELAAKHGAPTEKDYAWADRALGLHRSS
jgi:hypothetical protein